MRVLFIHYFNVYRKMLFLKRHNIWIILFLPIFFSACGYRFTGGGSFPAGIRSVCVSTIENRTSETGAENIFTNDLIYEVTRDNKVVLTTKDRADAQGAHSSHSLERRVTVAVDLQLTDPDGRVIWSAKAASANEAYDVMPDKMATERNRRNAISALSKRLMERLYARITDNF
jgi:hypothetical protein